MEKLSTLQGEVRLILEEKPGSRESDEVLYGIYLARHGVTTASVSTFFFNFKNYQVSDFESVTRCRRKIQERCPHLRPTEKITQMREEIQLDFIDFSRS